MKCYIHEERDAVGMCVQCKKLYVKNVQLE